MKQKEKLLSLEDFYNDLNFLGKEQFKLQKKSDLIIQKNKNLKIAKNNELIHLSKQTFKRFLSLDNINWNTHKISFYNNGFIFLNIIFTNSFKKQTENPYNDIQIFPVIPSGKPYKDGFQTLNNLAKIVKYIELNKLKILNKFNAKHNKYLKINLKNLNKDSKVYLDNKELKTNILPFSINRYIGLCITKNQEAKFTKGIQNPGVSFKYQSKYIIRIQRIFLKEPFKDLSTPTTLYLEDDEKNIYSISNFTLEKDFNILRPYAFDYGNFE